MPYVTRRLRFIVILLKLYIVIGDPKLVVQVVILTPLEARVTTTVAIKTTQTRIISRISNRYIITLVKIELTTRRILYLTTTTQQTRSQINRIIKRLVQLVFVLAVLLVFVQASVPDLEQRLGLGLERYLRLGLEDPERRLKLVVYNERRLEPGKRSIIQLSNFQLKSISRRPSSLRYRSESL